MREQFPGMPEADIDKLPDQLRDPAQASLRFAPVRGRECPRPDARRGAAALLPRTSTSAIWRSSRRRPARPGGGIGATLYERVREEAPRARRRRLFFECLPDDPALSPDPEITRQTTRRGSNSTSATAPARSSAPPTRRRSRPATPIRPTSCSIGSAGPSCPSRDRAQKVVRAILERKYAELPARLRRHGRAIDQGRSGPAAAAALRQAARGRTVKTRTSGERALRWSSTTSTTIHHVQERGYVEAPVRVRVDPGRARADGPVRAVAAQALLRPSHPRRA